MGQQSSKTTVEAQVIFQRLATQDICQKRSVCLASNPAVHSKRKLACHSACHHGSSARLLEKTTIHSWPQSRRDAGGLVYVMDNPTGGVWVKPEGKWTRSWRSDWIFRRCLHAGVKSSALSGFVSWAEPASKLSRMLLIRDAPLCQTCCPEESRWTSGVKSTEDPTGLITLLILSKWDTQKAMLSACRRAMVISAAMLHFQTENLSGLCLDGWYALIRMPTSFFFLFMPAFFYYWFKQHH